MIAAAVDKAIGPFVEEVDEVEREIHILRQSSKTIANFKEIAETLGIDAGSRHKKTPLVLPTFKQMAEAIASIPSRTRSLIAPTVPIHKGLTVYSGNKS